MSNNIEKLSNILFNQFKKSIQKNKNSGCLDILKLNIQSVDDVRCDAIFRFYNDSIQFIIESSQIITDNNSCEYIELYRDCIGIKRNLPDHHIKEWTDNFATDILETLPKLKLNIYGKLSTTADDVDIQLNNIFANFENISINNTDECCVCCNHTYTKTSCKHSLCYRCWFKLGKIEDDHPDDGLIFSCPICRGNINCLSDE